MVRRGNRKSVDLLRTKGDTRNLPNVPLVGAQAGFSSMSKHVGLVRVHPTGSPVIGTPFSGSPVPLVLQQQQQPSLEKQLLVQIVQQQQQQITQMMTRAWTGEPLTDCSRSAK